MHEYPYQVEIVMVGRFDGHSLRICFYKDRDAAVEQYKRLREAISSHAVRKNDIGPLIDVQHDLGASTLRVEDIRDAGWFFRGEANRADAKWNAERYRSVATIAHEHGLSSVS